ncbi:MULTISPECIES: hypothetical protein [Xanthomonas]|uniref:DUF3828 domain-containing protein n=1 Tax=Xanthomonas sacchari TaxID=56458 RepID=A0AA46SWW5_9XANT|nr:MULTISPECIES: hypothetical protein [Xanthomonas]KAB7779989.1 hypothetical protein CEK66_05690 [Xanthomonas sp. LMG 12460]MCW0365582.1 hypothetical protein [Xanthomonas sacchari]MCW0371340.1 hypothetical protein [Xanthomonas sacchari]MCW0388429.1 hypothetical protein [Xanthomonas sacchari]MCW0390068.1 hypothetical protein [Xanthomonas sacchari]
MHRRLALLTLFALSPVLAAAQPPGCQTPLQVAEGLFRARDVDWQPQNLEKLLTPPFAQALQADRRCARRDGRCRLDFAPWTDAQDGQLQGAPRFTLVSGGAQATVVEVRMDYRRTLGGAGSVKIELQRRGNGCWAVSDLIAPDGQSLFALLTDAQD